MTHRPEFDLPKFVAALDTIRHYKRISWRDLAADTGMSPSTFSRMLQGKRPDVDNLCRLLAWSHLDITDYIVTTDREQQR